MVSTGLKELDKVITGLELGDNVVWQVDAVEDYSYFVEYFIKKSLNDKKRLVYIRFASQKPIVKVNKKITVYELDAMGGFESFSSELHSIIKKEGEGVFYIFDCLSDLLSAWSNDLMIGNFFKITCPYLFKLDTIAYFGLLRNRHSFKTIARIRETTQLLIDVYRYKENLYIHPLKVLGRHSPTMFLPHVKSGDKLIPIANSVDAAKLFSDIFRRNDKIIERNLDYWDRLFINARNLTDNSASSREERNKMFDQLSKLLISREERMLKLAQEQLALEDIMAVKAKMIGTGYIGGKSVGMLIARNILLKEKYFAADKVLEPHDSFYVGSDVFYTYIVENGWWNERMEQKTKQGYFEVARTLKDKLLHGVFPNEIKEQFQQMIEYFGQSPIIVRSSSLLEDSYGNAFAGKYESFFLANQGSPEERYAKFLEAVRRIYASTMNENALTYRLQRGLDQADEQMALLVQRVSGSYHQDYFFPDAAGVGISYNTFVWTKTMTPEAGMLRIVFGLGTRAVNRVEGDYPRIVALDDPLRKATSGVKDVQRFSQHDVDVINIKKNNFDTLPLRQLLSEKVGMPLDLIAIRDEDANRRFQEKGIDEESWIITFDALVSRTEFSGIMQKILKSLETAYGYPVDIEFTVNFKKNNQFQINLLQCRPLQTKGLGAKVRIPQSLPEGKIIIKSKGNFLGGNILQAIDRIVYVDPSSYANLKTESQRYDIARLIGELNRKIGDKENSIVMLLGPGRWGTSTPTLGVPVSFAEISNISVLGEIAFKAASAMPELSFGTHFFQDLVETGIFYLSVFPGQQGMNFQKEFFFSLPNKLENLVPEYAKYEKVVRVLDVKRKKIKVASDISSQQLIVYAE